LVLTLRLQLGNLLPAGWKNISDSELAGEKSYSSALESIIRGLPLCPLGGTGGKGFGELQGLPLLSPSKWQQQVLPSPFNPNSPGLGSRKHF